MATRQTKRRISIILLVATGAFCLLVLRLSWLQLVRGDELASQASDIRTEDRVLEPKRGDIFDRNHNELVSSIPVNSVYVHPEQVKEPEVASAKIASILGMKYEEVLKKITSKDPFVWIKHKVDFEQTEKLKELRITGLGFVEGSKRSYKQANLAAHILGFVGDDNQGLNGIELAYDKELRGIPGRLVIEADGLGRKIPQTVARYFPPTQGQNLVLTIDQTIQYFVERELDNIVAEHAPARAVIIVMESKTGEILAMGSRPTFDPREWNKSSREIWDKNPATLYNYEPGSTFKIITAAAALEEATVREGDRFYDPGYYTVNGRRIYCDKRDGHGAESFAEGVQNSCNPVFIEVGLDMGKDRFYRYISGFGFGSPTGMDLPGEASGIVISKEKVTNLDLATMSMGQSIAVTPIQIATAVNAVASGGRLYKPLLVERIEDQDGKLVKKYEPELIRKVISDSTARQVALMLEKVVLEGTGKQAYVNGYRVGGKTGTAQVADPRGGYAAGKYVGSFVGFAPVNDPKITVLVMVSEPTKGGYHGGEVAAPAFQAIVRDTLRYLKVPETPGLPKPKGIREEVPEPVARAQQPTRISVPNVTGYPVEDAAKILRDKGLYARHDTKEGIVEKQNPSPGVGISRGGAVYLELVPAAKGKSADQPIVPDLNGLTVKRAGVVLEELGLKLKTTGTGLGIKQEPGPGTRVTKGSTVKVEFAPPKSSSN